MVMTYANEYTMLEIQKQPDFTTVTCRDAPDTDFAGYPSGRISGYSKIRIPDIRPDILSGRISGHFLNLKRYQINQIKNLQLYRYRVCSVVAGNFSFSLSFLLPLTLPFFLASYCFSFFSLPLFFPFFGFLSLFSSPFLFSSLNSLLSSSFLFPFPISLHFLSFLTKVKRVQQRSFEIDKGHKRTAKVTRGRLRSQKDC